MRKPQREWSINAERNMLVKANREVAMLREELQRAWEREIALRAQLLALGVEPQQPAPEQPGSEQAP